MTIIWFFTFLLIPAIMGGYKEKILLDFGNREEVPEWLIINDGVMGGVSTGEVEYLPAGYLKFTGNVSLKNNGGFSSFRTQSGYDLREFEGIKIRIRGDGKKYSFRLRSNNSYDGISYAADFQSVDNKWQEIEIFFTDFIPRFRGRIILNADKIDTGNIRQIGFLISDNQEGAFTLEIDWIKAFAYK